MTLTNPTDTELSAAVAEHVAGWTRVLSRPGLWTPPPSKNLMERGRYLTEIPPYATSADAVLPLLKKYDFTVAHLKGPPWEAIGFEVCIHRDDGQALVNNEGHDFISFPRAACIALLRAHGHEVEFTK